jgi:hypothetical protein
MEKKIKEKKIYSWVDMGETRRVGLVGGEGGGDIFFESSVG